MSQLPFFARRASCLAMSLAALALAGCKGGDAPAAAPTQVVATVNGQEISIHQINDAIAAQPVAPEAVEARRREILERLIDQKLAVQRATDKKLERTPDVMSAIESAKQEIISRAYFAQLLSGLQKPSNDEAAKYFADNPDIFARRRIYNLQEILLPAQGAPVDALRKMAAGKTIEEIAEWLRQQNIRFAANTATRGTDEVPLELVSRLAQLKDGQTGVFEFPQTVSVIRVVASKPAPVDEAEARPRILQFISNQRASAALTAEVKRLRDGAKIEYTAAAPDGAAAKAPQGRADAPNARPAPVVPNLEKSVSGLK